MRKHIFTFCLCLIAINFAIGQNCIQNFESANWETDCGYLFFIDSTNINNLIWQVGEPNKSAFDTAFSGTKAMVTDLDSFYPPNHNSSFYIYHTAAGGSTIGGGLEKISGYYKVQSDSLNDYGTIAISYDQGNSWIDLLNDTTYAGYINWFNIPTFTGTSKGWQHFEVDLFGLGSQLNISYGDSLLYRISFHSDSIPDTLAGLMFDALVFYDLFDDIIDKEFESFTSYAYPNPANKSCNVYFENDDSDFFEFKLYSLNGKQLEDTQYFKNEKIPVNIDRLSNGIYIYSLVSERDRKKSVGKFIVSK